ncbi:hypothetical protein [Halorhabdus tiamatea]|uniref:hypothetical protein n=1 Tax=Halorhabdus tiamatea TaxID=430914 RepID=UPI00130EDF3B|nr:hypothetical protein [Halorhabdus tiamatea]
MSEDIVDDGFEFNVWNGVQLCGGVFVGVRSTSGVGDGLDGFLIDSRLEECLADDPRVEAAAFDSRDWNLCEQNEHYSFKLRGRKNGVCVAENPTIPIQTLSGNLTTSVLTTG